MKDTLTDVILSIKPIYAQAIMRGEKKVEFRKQIFKKPVDKVLVYSSSPEKKIIGYFTIKGFETANPEELWEKYNKVGCIDKNAFFEYYKNSEKGVSIIINDFKKFTNPIDPKELIKNFCAPQSYIYVDSEVSAKASA